MSGTRDWDAGTYDRVSAPQLEWGRALIDRMGLAGNERVLDAGCGSGRVTELLVEALPKGEVVAADGSRAMAELARERFGTRVEVIHSDLLQLSLAEPVDAVFSSATFHWITDHARLFERIGSWLRPGGRLEAQCGGEGNIAAFVELTERVAGRDPFRAHLEALPDSRYFATPAATRRRLADAGFEAAECWLEDSEQRPPEPRAFIESVCLGAHTAALPEALRSDFVDSVFASWGEDPVLEYVRLNISARKGPAG